MNELLVWERHANIEGEVEARIITATLDTAEWQLNGPQSRVFIIMSGTGKALVADEDTVLHAPCLVLVPKDTPTLLTLNAGSRGAWLALSDAALGQVAMPVNIAEDMRRLLRHPQLGIPLTRKAGQELSGFITALEEEIVDGRAASEDVVRHLLAVICIHLWRVSTPIAEASRPAPRAIVANFIQLVELNVRNHWSVSDYATYLGVTTDRLNSAVQRATGKTPLTVIHTRLMREARQMIEGSAMQISEIANVLGFDDAAYFSRFFRRRHGRSPRQYRDDFIRAQTVANTSYAAWP